MRDLIKAELRLLIRNPLVLACAILIPLMFAGMILAMKRAAGGAPGAAVLIVVSLATIGIYLTATTTLAARRQTLYLKRVRVAGLPLPSVLAGLLGPVVAINLLQVGVILGVLAAIDTPPKQAWWLVVGMLVLDALLVACAVGTAAVTRSPEHAQVTTMPLFLLFFGIATIVVALPERFPLWLRRTVPGGAASELIMGAWTTLSLGTAALLVGITLGWTVLVGWDAARRFTWEPRSDAS